jgi:hypothetical protein
MIKLSSIFDFYYFKLPNNHLFELILIASNQSLYLLTEFDQNYFSEIILSREGTNSF